MRIGDQLEDEVRWKAPFCRCVRMNVGNRYRPSLPPLRPGPNQSPWELQRAHSTPVSFPDSCVAPHVHAHVHVRFYVGSILHPRVTRIRLLTTLFFRTRYTRKATDHPRHTWRRPRQPLNHHLAITSDNAIA